jgi:hypothetical protein
MTLPLPQPQRNLVESAPTVERDQSGTFPRLALEAREQYLAQDEFVVVDHLFDDARVEKLRAEALALTPYITRKHVPFYKKSGSVGYHRIRELAPAVLDLYRDPELLRFLRDTTGAQDLDACPDGDPHAAALYYYTEPGDRIGFHYDSSHYAGARYTVLLGLVDESSSRLVCRMFTRDKTREPVEEQVALLPGTLALFNGRTLYHAVTPLGENERRIVLTLEYVTDARMTPMRRALSDLKDAVTYFGFKELLRGRRGQGSAG